jgi:hypothetical protein
MRPEQVCAEDSVASFGDQTLRAEQSSATSSERIFTGCSREYSLLGIVAESSQGLSFWVTNKWLHQSFKSGRDDASLFSGGSRFGVENLNRWHDA